MEVAGEDFTKERRSGKFSSLDSSFIRDKLLKKGGGIAKKALQGISPKKPEVKNSNSLDLGLIKEKLISCTKIYTFGKSEPCEEREQKTKFMNELLDWLDSSQGAMIFKEELLPQTIDMLKANLFRPFHFITKPSSSTSTLYEAEDEETLLEASWPHLQLAYQFLLRLLIFPQFSGDLAQQYINTSFIKQFIWLFQSEDARERDFLKNLLHRMYGKFVCLRPEIKCYVQNSLVQFVYENDEESNGVCELLEVFEAIINGFKVPLKQENVEFLIKYLIPLHKAKSLPNFHQQLSKCMSKFISKDSKIGIHIYSGILKFWPLTNSIKEVNFLNEFEELLDCCTGSSLTTIECKLFKKLCKCISSPHFQVAEKALLMLNNDKVIDILSRNKTALYPSLVGSLMYNSESHWNSYISMLTLNSIKVLMDLDMKLFESSSHKQQEERLLKSKKREELEKKWGALEQSISSSH